MSGRYAVPLLVAGFALVAAAIAAALSEGERSTDGTITNAKSTHGHHQQGGNNFWGVQVFSQGGKEYVTASDMAYGLYIFEYTP